MHMHIQYKLFVKLVCHTYQKPDSKNKPCHLLSISAIQRQQISNLSSKLRFQSEAELLLDASPHLYSVILQLPLPLLSISLSPRGACLFLPSGCKTEAYACHERAHTQQGEIKGHRDISSASDQTICATFFFYMHSYICV